MSNFSEKQKAIMIKKHHKKFQESRLKIIKKIKLSNIMKKNPYLYAARNFQTSKELVDSILRDLITSSDETIFGDVFFEPLGMEISKGNVSVGKGTDFSNLDLMFKMHQLQKNKVRNSLKLLKDYVKLTNQ